MPGFYSLIQQYVQHSYLLITTFFFFILTTTWVKIYFKSGPQTSRTEPLWAYSISVSIKSKVTRSSICLFPTSCLFIWTGKAHIMWLFKHQCDWLLIIQASNKQVPETLVLGSEWDCPSKHLLNKLKFTKYLHCWRLSRW